MQLLADALDDHARRGQVAFQRSVIASHAGLWHEADAAAQQALACATRCGDEGLRLRALQRRAVALRSLGDYTGARTIAEQALAEARAGSHPVESLALRHQTMALARKLGNRRSEIVALANLGNSERQLGNYGAARQHLKRAIGHMRRADDRVMLCSPLAALALVCVAQGEAAQALHHAEKALALAHNQGAMQKAPEAQLAVGEAHLALGDPAAAAPVIAHVEGGGSLQGGQTHPIEHICFRVLQWAGDARADAWLQRAHASLQEEAGRIADDAMHQRFLHGVAHNAQVMAA